MNGVYRNDIDIDLPVVPWSLARRGSRSFARWKKSAKLPPCGASSSSPLLGSRQAEMEMIGAQVPAAAAAAAGEAAGLCASPLRSRQRQGAEEDAAKAPEATRSRSSSAAVCQTMWTMRSQERAEVPERCYSLRLSAAAIAIAAIAIAIFEIEIAIAEIAIAMVEIAIAFASTEIQFAFAVAGPAGAAAAWASYQRLNLP